MKTKLFSLIALAALFVVAQASATTVDFRNSFYSSFEGNTSGSFVAGGVGITVQAFSNFSIPTTGKIDWDDDYGFGIKGGTQSDEIDTCEELLITFSQSVSLSSLTLYNLNYPDSVLFRQEIGYYSLNGGPVVQFSAQLFNGGRLYLPIPETLVTSIAFYATPSDSRNEFSVGGLSFCKDCTDVPEPASMMLLGTGLIAFARLRRRKI